MSSLTCSPVSVQEEMRWPTEAARECADLCRQSQTSRNTETERERKGSVTFQNFLNSQFNDHPENLLTGVHATTCHLWELQMYSCHLVAVAQVVKHWQLLRGPQSNPGWHHFSQSSNLNSIPDSALLYTPLSLCHHRMFKNYILKVLTCKSCTLASHDFLDTKSPSLSTGWCSRPNTWAMLELATT